MPRQVRRLLVVDDDDGVRNVVAARLRKRGYEVDTASNGQHALDLLRESRKPDAIVLDLMMPVMSGWEFLDARAGDESLRLIPVLILASHAHEQISLRAVIGIFRKPDEIDRMMEALDAHFAGGA